MANRNAVNLFKRQRANSLLGFDEQMPFGYNGEPVDVRDDTWFCLHRSSLQGRGHPADDRAESSSPWRFDFDLLELTVHEASHRAFAVGFNANEQARFVRVRLVGV